MPTSHAVLRNEPDTFYTIQDWLRRPPPRGTPVCPICDSDITTRGELNESRDPHFLHRGASQCPSINQTGPYAGLADVPYDPARRAEVQQYVVDHLYAVLTNCRTLAPGLSIDEFDNLLQAANAHDVWAFRDLRPEFVPYLLVLCQGRFEPNKYRTNPFFFALSRKRRVDALWIHASPATHILRIEIPSAQVTPIAILATPLIEPAWIAAKRDWLRGTFGLR